MSLIIKGLLGLLGAGVIGTAVIFVPKLNNEEIVPVIEESQAEVRGETIEIPEPEVVEPAVIVQDEPVKNIPVNTPTPTPTITQPTATPVSTPTPTPVPTVDQAELDRIEQEKQLAKELAKKEYEAKKLAEQYKKECTDPITKWTAEIMAIKDEYFKQLAILSDPMIWTYARDAKIHQLTKETNTKIDIINNNIAQTKYACSIKYQ